MPKGMDKTSWGRVVIAHLFARSKVGCVDEFIGSFAKAIELQVRLDEVGSDRAKASTAVLGCRQFMVPYNLLRPGAQPQPFPAWQVHWVMHRWHVLPALSVCINTSNLFLLISVKDAHDDQSIARSGTCQQKSAGNDPPTNGRICR